MPLAAELAGWPASHSVFGTIAPPRGGATRPALARGSRRRPQSAITPSCFAAREPLATPEEALRRVGQRVRRGGHGIPEDVVRRRFDRSVGNFRHVYRDLVDSWQVVDRSGRALVLVEEGDNR